MFGDVNVWVRGKVTTDQFWLFNLYIGGIKCLKVALRSISFGTNCKLVPFLKA